jgi:hypothetical protein
MKKPVLVVTPHFIKPVETRINNEYEVRRKGDGTSFTREELLTATDGADAILITPFDRLDADFFRRVSPLRQGDLNVFRWRRPNRYACRGRTKYRNWILESIFSTE